MRRTGKAIGTLAAATSLALVGSGLAYADDLEHVIAGNATSVVLTPGSSTSSATVGVLVDAKNGGVNSQGNVTGDGDAGCNIDVGETLTLSVQTPNGITATPASVTFGGTGANPVYCGTAQNIVLTAAAGATAGRVTVTIGTNTTGIGTYRNQFSVPVIFDTDGDGVVDSADNCPNAANSTQADADGDGLGDACDSTPNGVVVVVDTDADTVADASDNCPDVANATQVDADGDGIGDACDSNSYAPAISTQADDANGTEGATLSTSGAFTDQDPNTTISLSLLSGAGALTPSTTTNGAFSWSHSSSDDDSGQVTVRATDGEKTTDMTFRWSAANAAPVVNAPAVTFTSACAVSVNATFSDAGSSDTHTGEINWGDGATAAASVAAASASASARAGGTHTFSGAGTYTISVTVTDDDHSAAVNGRGSSASGVTTMNTPSVFGAPINTTGTRSSFKLGSSIPLKITVKDCGNNDVTTLSPLVHLTQGDSTPDFPVNEDSVGATATNGKSMRWDGTQYHYVLSTKASQFHNGAALTTGTFTVQVSDPSFFQAAAIARALFDLRK